VTQLLQQLDCLVALHGRDRVAAWKQLAAEQRWVEMVERLLEEHYDPAYHRSISRNFARADEAAELAMDSEDDAEFVRAAKELAA
jgi:tRNA 2-selenouridine synthase